MMTGLGAAETAGEGHYGRRLSTGFMIADLRITDLKIGHYNWGCADILFTLFTAKRHGRSRHDI